MELEIHILITGVILVEVNVHVTLSTIRGHMCSLHAKVEN